MYTPESREEIESFEAMFRCFDPLAKSRTDRTLRDGEPCNHPGCLAHISHPCEGCGRVCGITKNVQEGGE